MFNFLKSKKRIFNKGANESYIMSKFIYGGFAYKETKHTNVLILVAFTDDYLQDAVEFCGNSPLTTKYVKSYIERRGDKKDEFMKTSVDSYNVHYVLVGGDLSDYCKLFETISLSNSIVNAILTEIYLHTNSYYFNSLIEAGILRLSLFKNNEINQSIVTHCNCNFDIYNDPANVILDSLPSWFNGRDLLDFCYIYDEKDYYSFRTLISKLDSFSDRHKTFVIEIAGMFNGILEDYRNIDSIRDLLKPIYTQADNNIDIPTESEEVLDDLFKENVNAYTGIVNEDDSVQMIYKDINTDVDEILSIDSVDNNLQKVMEE